MSKKRKVSWAVMLSGYLLVILLMLLLLSGSMGFVNAGAKVENVTYVNSMLASVDGGPEQMVELPHSFQDLAPRTKVTLRATIFPNSDDTVYVKSVYSPAKIYLNGEFQFEYGQQVNYPSWMIDPATEMHLTETNGDGGPMELAMEFWSPRTRNVMTIHPPIVGNAKEITLERCHYLGIPLALAIAQMIYGASLILISMCLMLVDRKGQSFLWLGLMALMSGLWVFGENNFSGFMFKNATMLYLLAFIGFFTFIIPLLRFTRITVDFENPWPLWGMELFTTASAGIAFLLQFMGVLQLSSSMYYFHVILPLNLVALTALVIREAIKYHNHNAKRFALPIAVLTLMAFLELLNYRIVITYIFSSLFQVGIIFFLLVMGVTAGLAVKESVNIRNQEKELQFQQGLMDIQIKEQTSRSQLLREHEQLLSRQRHDLRHQLNVIMEMARDNPELLSYLENLTNQLPKPSKIFCENRAVNAILSHYVGVCQEKGIRLQIQVAVPGCSDRVDDSQLCVVFGNLLENAVEACQRMTEGEKFITLRSRMQKELLIITMDNSFNGQLRQNGQNFYSSKRNEAYGIGLASVRSVARDAGGEAQFEGEGNTFRASLYLHV